jgi:hypothetical protein
MEMAVARLDSQRMGEYLINVYIVSLVLT